jgi:hypothetical protein
MVSLQELVHKQDHGFEAVHMGAGPNTNIQFMSFHDAQTGMPPGKERRNVRSKIR